MTKEIKKDIIADAALSCFLASGYGATSVDEIAKASGMSKGGIYWHFKSKEDIFLYIITRMIDEWNNHYLATLKETRTASDKLSKYVEHRINEVDAPIIALVLEFLLQNKDKENVIKMNCEIHKPTSIIYNIIKEAIDNGEFKPLDPNILTLSFLAIFDGIVLQIFMHKNKQLLEKTVRTALDIFLTGVRAS
ncbi:TetR/AcrR family transcriptional regulator [Desulfotomaculum defluvii]